MTLLLLVYVTLDFANPLMPGAVRFDGGAVRVVHADRAHAPTPVTLVKLVRVPEDVVHRAPRVQGPGRPSPVQPPRRRQVARIPAAPIATDPAPSSEDH